MAPSSPEPPRPRAVRLTFSYGPEGVHLIDRQTIEKRVAAGDDLPPELDATTVAAELRSSDETATFRRVVPQAIRRDVEVFDPDLPGGVRRDPSPPGRGVFTVLVPEAAAADHVVLLARPSADDLAESLGGRAMDEQGARPVEIGRFPMRAEPRDGNS